MKNLIILIYVIILNSSNAFASEQEGVPMLPPAFEQEVAVDENVPAKSFWQKFKEFIGLSNDEKLIVRPSLENNHDVELPALENEEDYNIVNKLKDESPSKLIIEEKSKNTAAPEPAAPESTPDVNFTYGGTEEGPTVISIPSNLVNEKSSNEKAPNSINDDSDEIIIPQLPDVLPEALPNGLPCIVEDDIKAKNEDNISEKPTAINVLPDNSLVKSGEITSSQSIATIDKTSEAEVNIVEKTNIIKDESNRKEMSLPLILPDPDSKEGLRQADAVVEDNKMDNDIKLPAVLGDVNGNNNVDTISAGNLPALKGQNDSIKNEIEQVTTGALKARGAQNFDLQDDSDTKGDTKGESKDDVEGIKLKDDSLNGDAIQIMKTENIKGGEQGKSSEADQLPIPDYANLPALPANPAPTASIDSDISKYKNEFEANKDNLVVPKISEQELSADNSNSDNLSAVEFDKLQKDKLEFISNEMQVLELPDDDIVLGVLSREAQLEQMDFKSYVESFWLFYAALKAEPKSLEIDEYINNYLGVSN